MESTNPRFPEDYYAGEYIKQREPKANSDPRQMKRIEFPGSRTSSRAAHQSIQRTSSRSNRTTSGGESILVDRRPAEIRESRHGSHAPPQQESGHRRVDLSPPQTEKIEPRRSVRPGTPTPARDSDSALALAILRLIADADLPGCARQAEVHLQELEQRWGDDIARLLHFADSSGRNIAHHAAECEGYPDECTGRLRNTVFHSPFPALPHRASPGR